MATRTQKSREHGYVINPNTGRPIMVGGDTWKKLHKAGVLDNNYRDPKELYKIDIQDLIDNKIKEINAGLPPNKMAVRGVGQYKGSLIVKERGVINGVQRSRKEIGMPPAPKRYTQKSRKPRPKTKPPPIRAGRFVVGETSDEATDIPITDIDDTTAGDWSGNDSDAIGY